MAHIEWQIRGVELANCNCATGCPCQFNALPTHGDCRAMTAIRIDEGHFGEVPLAGLSVAFMAAWPGPIHFGGGIWQSVIDERADPRQREALQLISTGQHTDPGGSIFQIFASVTSSVLETLYRPIEFDVDSAAGTGRVRIPGVMETDAAPIVNPVTGLPHRARVKLPAGFEYDEAEFIAGRTRTTAAIPLAFEDSHAHIARVHWSTHGVIR